MQKLNYAKLKVKACKTSKVIEQEAQYKYIKFYSGSVQSIPTSTPQVPIKNSTIIPLIIVYLFFQTHK